MGHKTKNFLQEIYLILATIIGMGFASGKEILHFFCYNKALSIFSVVIFVVLFSMFFNSIKKYQKANNIKDFNQLNNHLFKENSKYVNVILIIIYSICSSCMLAGADILAKDLFNISLPIVSFLLSICLFFILIGGVGRIKKLFSTILPVMLLLIFLNLFVNSWNILPIITKVVDFKCALNLKSVFLSVVFPIIFWGGNTILIINSILQIKSNHKLINLISSIIFLILMILGVVVIVGLNLNNSMPFLTSSSNLSNVFYFIYLLAIILSLFSSLVISSNNIVSILNVKTIFGITLILIINQAIAFLGFEFIVEYLYTFSGLLGLIYCFVVWFKLKVNSKKLNEKSSDNLNNN